MLKNILDAFSPSGSEDEMRDILTENLSSLFDDTKTDNLGSLIFHKAGRGTRICIECGMDTIGIMVTAHTEQKVYFAMVGGIAPQLLENKSIKFNGGARGIIRYDGENISNAKPQDLYIELDSGSVKIGEFGALDPCFSISENYISSHDLGYKVPIFAVLEAISNTKITCDLTVIFSSQKRLGARGIAAFFGENNFDVVLTVDSISAKGNIKSGDGALLVAKDKKCVSTPSLLRDTELRAKENNISCVTAVCDENLYIENISIAGKGSNCLSVAIPIEHRGKGNERVHRSDITSAAELIKLILQGGNKNG